MIIHNKKNTTRNVEEEKETEEKNMIGLEEELEVVEKRIKERKQKRIYTQKRKRTQTKRKKETDDEIE